MVEICVYLGLSVLFDEVHELGELVRSSARRAERVLIGTARGTRLTRGGVGGIGVPVVDRLAEQ
jgi:hypothetical protein